MGKGILRNFLLCWMLTAALLVQAQPNQGRQSLGGTAAADRITREVRHELLMQPYYTIFDWLAFKVDGDNVTLLGQVVDPQLKSDAQASVKHIEGIGTVTNNIEVLPPNPDDDRIRRDVYRAIYNYDGLFKYAWGSQPPIHIIVKTGHVTLVGPVDSQQDKQLAEMRAKTVPGVFSVDDQLEVAGNKTK